MRSQKENFRTEKAVYCVICGEKADETEEIYRIHGLDYCCSCLDDLDVDTLVRICEIPKRKWLEQMGFEYVGNAKIRRYAYGK